MFHQEHLRGLPEQFFKYKYKGSQTLYTFPGLPSCPLLAPSYMQFQANMNQFRELHRQINK